MSIRARLVAAAVTGACVALAAGLPAVVSFAEAGVPVAGIWLDNEGKARVEVEPCGGELCGSIVWLKQPLDPNGKPWTDMLNPDRARRARPVCGLQIIGGLKPGGSGLWQGGWIYDPEAGKQFDVELSLQDADTLKVFGFAGVRLLSETMLWKREPANAQRCKA